MFTGLVEEMGTIDAIGPQGDGFVLTVRASKILRDVGFGESININGVCLSVIQFDAQTAQFGLAPETLRLTNLGDLKVGDPVNLERAVLPTTRLGGHYVQGHVDGTGDILKIEPDGDALNITISAPRELMKYIVRKGYICVDGTSLTITGTGDDWFSLTLISHTQDLVILSRKTVGEKVNLEVDIMAKYAEKSLQAWRTS